MSNRKETSRWISLKVQYNPATREVRLPAFIPLPNGTFLANPITAAAKKQRAPSRAEVTR